MERSNCLHQLMQRGDPPPSSSVQVLSASNPMGVTSEISSPGGTGTPPSSVQIQILPASNATGVTRGSEPPPSSAEIGVGAGGSVTVQIRVDPTSREKLEMQHAVMKGDEKLCNNLLQLNPTLISESISSNGDLALQRSVAFGHEKLLGYFLQTLSSKGSDYLGAQLSMRDGSGFTVACYASIVGSINIAKTLMEGGRRDIFLKPDGAGITPLEKACIYKKKELFDYLIKPLVKIDMVGLERRFHILVKVLEEGWFDSAVNLIEKDRDIVESNSKLLQLISGMEPRRLYMEPVETLLDIFCKKRRIQKKALETLTDQFLSHAKEDESSAFVLRPILTELVKKGNVELFCDIALFNPELLTNQDEEGCTVFHTAIKYRRRSIFNLLHQMGAQKYRVLNMKDTNDNTVLHLAAAFVQLNRGEEPQAINRFLSELRWFNDIKEMVPTFLNSVNSQGKTPKQLFDETHRTLEEEANAWTRNFSVQGLLVASLMFTAMFAAIFTVPGGLKSETGVPILHRDQAFLIFLLSEMVAMPFSLCSVAMFFGLILLKYTSSMFGGKIQQRLGLGLAFLVITMVASTASFFGGFLVAASGTHLGFQLVCYTAFGMVTTFQIYRAYKLALDLSSGRGKLKDIFLKKFKLL